MKKSKHLEILSAHVANGKTIRAAAELIGISEATAYAVSSSDEFRLTVGRLRTEAVNAAVGVLSRAATTAAETLVSMLGEDQEPKDRLTAARLILSNLGPVTDLGELRERVSKIESQGPGLRIAK